MMRLIDGFLATLAYIAFTSVFLLGLVHYKLQTTASLIVLRLISSLRARLASTKFPEFHRAFDFTMPFYLVDTATPWRELCPVIDVVRGGKLFLPAMALRSYWRSARLDEARSVAKYMCKKSRNSIKWNPDEAKEALSYLRFSEFQNNSRLNRDITEISVPPDVLRKYKIYRNACLACAILNWSLKNSDVRAKKLVSSGYGRKSVWLPYMSIDYKLATKLGMSDSEWQDIESAMERGDTG